MNIEQFLCRSDSFSVEPHYCNQDLLEHVRELACLGLKLFPVSLAAMLNGFPDKFISAATSDNSLLEELSVAAQPLWGHRLALGPSGLCVLILDGAVGRESFSALLPDIEECLTLQARCGDVVYAFFQQPARVKRIVSATKLAQGVIILGDGESCIVPPYGGATWMNPNAEIEVLPYALRELLAVENPDNFLGRAMLAPKPSPSKVRCGPAARFPEPNLLPRKGHPVCGQGGWRGYRICRQR